MVRPFFLPCFFLMSSALSAELFDARFQQILLAACRTAKETQLAQRILNLQLSYQEAVQMTERIPFITEETRQELLRALEDTDTGAEETGQDLLSAEEREVLRRYLYQVVHSEEQVRFVRGLLLKPIHPGRLEAELRQAEFLSEAELRQVQRIVKGELLQFAETEWEDRALTAQSVEVSSMLQARSREDLLPADLTRIKVTHSILATDRLDDQEYSADVSVSLGNSIWHSEEDARLERMRLEFRNRAHAFSVGDQIPADLTLSYQSPWFGASWEIHQDDSEIEVFAGVMEREQILNSKMAMNNTWVTGARYRRSTPSTRLFGLEILTSRDEDRSGLSLTNAGWFMEKRLSDTMDFRTELALSQGGPKGQADRTDGAGSVSLRYFGNQHNAEFLLRRQGGDWVSALGQPGQDSLEFMSRAGSALWWGDLELEYSQSRTFLTSQEAWTSERPALFVRWREPLGEKDLHFDFHALRKQDDSLSNLSRDEADTLHFGLSKGFRNITAEASLRLREMESLSAALFTRDRERVVHTALRSSSLMGNRTLWPSMYWQRQRYDEGGRLISHRDTLVVDLQTEIFSRTQALVEWSYQKQASPNALARHESMHTRISLEHPLDAVWDQSFELRLLVEEALYSGGLFKPQGTSMTVAWHNQF